MLLQLFLPGIESSSLSYLFPSGDASSSSYSVRYGTASKQQPSASSNWQQSGLTATSSQLAGPQYSPPVATAKFTPAVTFSGLSTLQTGGAPGGIFASAQTGGLTAGSYGGGYLGPYNAATGTYGLGASYGFAKPYQGKAAGTAVVFMPAAFAPNAPNITYPCPLGASLGSMLTAGIPCGVPVTSVPAAWLPTNGGLPAGVDLSKIPGVSLQA
eukprot:gene3929-4183_t